jgi:hypothetical protein
MEVPHDINYLVTILMMALFTACETLFQGTTQARTSVSLLHGT